MDIMDLFGDNRDRISELNNGAKYILILLNSLTKRVYAYPLKNRKNPNIIKVLKTAFKDMGLKEYQNKKHFLSNLQVDKEFIVGKKLQEFFKHYCLNVYYSQSDFKASMAERFVKYCKEKITSRMESLRTEHWTPLLKDVVLQYNTMRKHSSTGLTPMTAEKYPSAALIRILERNNRKARNYALNYKFKIGQVVRLSEKSHNIFRKNYRRRFTANTFIIYQRRKVKYLNIYYLKTRKGEEMKGSFREDALRKANAGDNGNLSTNTKFALYVDYFVKYPNEARSKSLPLYFRELFLDKILNSQSNFSPTLHYTRSKKIKRKVYLESYKEDYLKISG